MRHAHCKHLFFRHINKCVYSNACTSRKEKMCVRQESVCTTQATQANPSKPKQTQTTQTTLTNHRTEPNQSKAKESKPNQTEPPSYQPTPCSIHEKWLGKNNKTGNCGWAGRVAGVCKGGRSGEARSSGGAVRRKKREKQWNPLPTDKKS